jgi:hypothetical protein
VEPSLPRSRARRALSAFAVIVVGVPLAACLGTDIASPPPTNIDGSYAGEAVRSGNSRLHCPVRRQLSINVNLGELRGEIVGDDGGARAAQRFAAFVEAGGKVAASVRIGDDFFALEGRLDGRVFRGEARSDSCTMSLFARRSDGG